jgi:hypothetical protein
MAKKSSACNPSQTEKTRLYSSWPYQPHNISENFMTPPKNTPAETSCRVHFISVLSATEYARPG